MLIRQLLWRERAQYSPPESPPLSLSLSRAPSRYILLLPSSATHDCPPATIHLLSTLLRFNHFPSPHFRSCPPLMCPRLSFACILVEAPLRLALVSCNTISWLNAPHPAYLFAWLSQHCRSPFSRFLSLERLSIPLASRLIFHPRRGYRRKGGLGGGLAWETEGRRLRHLFKFSLPTDLFT